MRSSLILVFLVVCVSCLRPLDQARRDYAQALTDQHIALVEFQIWDRAHQFALIRAATCKEKAQQALTDYRSRRKKLQDQVVALVKQEDQAVDLLLSLDKEEAAVEIAEQQKSHVSDMKQAIAAFEQQEEKELIP